MKRTGEFVKSTLISGALVILPLGLVVMIVLKIIAMLRPMANALVGHLPYGSRFPDLVASLFLLLACVLVGLLAETRAGRSTGNFLETGILNRIPGYSMVRSLTRRIGDMEETEKFSPALAEIEDALVPAFVVEKHADGQYTVFVPSAPTPGVGSIYILTENRVHLLDVPFLKAVKCVSRWGEGSGELLKGMRQKETTKS